MSSASVHVAGEVIGAIDRGLLVFVCAEPNDGSAQVQRFVDKVLKLRIFGDADGRMNRSVKDVDGGLLVVSQFTLAADLRSGNRPGFTGAAPGELGERLYDAVLAEARRQHAFVACGQFGADMQVHLINDGPITIPVHIA